MPRMPATTCRGSTCATDTLWFCTTMPTGYDIGLGESPLSKEQPQQQFVKTITWLFLRNKIQTVRGSKWDTWSEFRIGGLCAKKVTLDKG